MYALVHIITCLHCSTPSRIPTSQGFCYLHFSTLHHYSTIIVTWWYHSKINKSKMLATDMQPIRKLASRTKQSEAMGRSRKVQWWSLANSALRSDQGIWGKPEGFSEEFEKMRSGLVCLQGEQEGRGGSTDGPDTGTNAYKGAVLTFLWKKEKHLGFGMMRRRAVKYKIKLKI